jgi:hypothetical protein
MQKPIRGSIRIGLFSLLMSVAFGPGLAFAQSGSAGGSIGNDEKSLSGSREAPRSAETPARRSKPAAEEPRRASQKGSGGGGGNFDGMWTFTGVSTNCNASATVSGMISGGKALGPGNSGGVSPNGAYHSVNVGSDGIVLTAIGRLSGSHGSGTYTRTDGCNGRWSASKQ